MQEPKRILLVITKANWGGAQKYVYDVALAARAAGHEVAVAYGEEGELRTRLAAAGIRTIGVSGIRNKASFAALMNAYRSLYELFKEERPDAVHLNSSLASAAGALAARRARLGQIIFTAHGWAFNEDRSFLQKLLIRFFAWMTVLLSHKTICVSDAVKRDIEHFPFTRCKLIVIKNGVTGPVLLAREDARAALLPDHMQKLWVGMVSELHPTKRVEDAIAAFKMIASQQPETILVVAGEGQERGRLEKMIANLDLGDKVFLLGFVKDIDQKLLAFDIFLHTSRSEALGLAILEAGSAGLPVVATSVGGIPEIIGDGVNGLLVPAKSPDQVARALAKLIADPALAHKLGENLQARIAKDFSKESMLEATLALYSPAEA